MNLSKLPSIKVISEELSASWLEPKTTVNLRSSLGTANSPRNRRLRRSKGSQKRVKKAGQSQSVITDRDSLTTQTLTSVFLNARKLQAWDRWLDNSEIQLKTWMPTTDCDLAAQQHQQYVKYLTKLKSVFSGKYLDRVTEGLSKTLQQMQDAHKYQVEQLQNDRSGLGGMTLNRTWQALSINSINPTKSTQTVPLDQLDPKGHAEIARDFIDTREFQALQDQLMRWTSEDESNCQHELQSIAQRMSFLSGMTIDKIGKNPKGLLNPEDFKKNLYFSMEQLHRQTKYSLVSAIWKERIDTASQTYEKLIDKYQYAELEDELNQSKDKLIEANVRYGHLEEQIQIERTHYNSIKHESAVQSQDIRGLEEELIMLKQKIKDLQKTIIEHERSVLKLQGEKKEALVEVRKQRAVIAEKTLSVDNLTERVKMTSKAMDELRKQVGISGGIESDDSSFEGENQPQTFDEEGNPVFDSSLSPSGRRKKKARFDESLGSTQSNPFSSPGSRYQNSTRNTNRDYSRQFSRDGSRYIPGGIDGSDEDEPGRQHGGSSRRQNEKYLGGNRGGNRRLGSSSRNPNDPHANRYGPNSGPNGPYGSSDEEGNEASQRARQQAWRSNNRLPKGGYGEDDEYGEYGDHPGSRSHGRRGGPGGHSHEPDCDHQHRETGAMSPGGHYYEEGEYDENDPAFERLDGRSALRPGTTGGALTGGGKRRKALSKAEIKKIMDDNPDMTYEDLYQSEAYQKAMETLNSAEGAGDKGDKAVAFLLNNEDPFNSGGAGTSPSGRKLTRRGVSGRLYTCPGQPQFRTADRYGTVPAEIWIGHSEKCGENCEHLKRAMAHRRWKEIGKPMKMNKPEFMYDDA